MQRFKLIWHVIAFPPLNGTVPARRGTAAAARHRAPCTRRAPPGMSPPSPRRAPWRGRRGRAAVQCGVLRTSGRGGATRSSRGAGRFRPSGVAAGLPAAPAPWAPAADLSGGEPCSASRSFSELAASHAAFASWPRGRFFDWFCSSRRHFDPKCVVCKSIWFRKDSIFHLFGWYSHHLHHSKTKLIKENINKTSIQFATPTYDCSLVAVDMLIESRFQRSPAGPIESWHGRMSGTSLGGGAGH